MTKRPSDCGHSTQLYSPFVITRDHFGREEKGMGRSEYDPGAKERRPWNAGRLLGGKRALKAKQVWAIRFWLDHQLHQ